MCGLHNTTDHGIWLKMPKNEKWKCRAMSNIRKNPTSKVRSGRVLCRYSEIESYPMAKLHMFSKQTLLTTSRLWETKPCIRNSLPCIQLHTHAYVHTHRSREAISASIYPNALGTVLAMYIISFNESICLHRFSFPVSQSSPEHPHFALPEASYHSPAACGMAIHEQTWILTDVTFGLNSRLPSNTTIADWNKSLHFNW